MSGASESDVAARPIHRVTTRHDGCVVYKDDDQRTVTIFDGRFDDMGPETLLSARQHLVKRISDEEAKLQELQAERAKAGVAANRANSKHSAAMSRVNSSKAELAVLKAALSDAIEARA